MTDVSSEGAAADNTLDGGGELGALMRSFDWSTTPLGSPAGWPRSLKTAVRIMLTSRQPFWLGWGPELTYLYNDAYKSIIGGKHPWALGRPFSEVWSEIWDVVGPMARQVIADDAGTYVEAQLLIMERHGYAEETYYTFSYSPVTDDDGRVAGIICANTEDTGRVVGERQLALLGELAARTSRARTWRDACELGVAALASNARDIPFALLFVDGPATSGLELAAATRGAAGLAGALQSLAERVGPRGSAETVAFPPPASTPTGDWQKPPHEVALLPLPAAGQGRGGVLVVGLNPFRRFDAGYRGFLELAAGQLGAAIANAEAYERERQRAESLAEVDHAKTTFFSNVSHEFRTPLTLMLGPLEDLLARADGFEVHDHQLLATMHRNGRRLLKLVNTLLDFARIEAGRAQTRFEPTDLGALTADLAATFRAACEKAGLALDVRTPREGPVAWVDREMWEKVVLNLVSNAFKFTFAGSIGVAIDDDAERVRLVVRDSGSGIPAGALPQMFQRFYRVEGSVGRSHEGSGIGLALVQELVRLHGGSIAVASELQRGSTFTVEIPKGRAHLPADRVKADAPAPAVGTRAGAYVEEVLSWLPEQASSQEAVTAPAEAARVLVADDNADLREYLRRLLGEHYQVRVAADGEDALREVRQWRPALVVSDVMMPRLDGFGLVRAIRADAAVSSTPIILLSARAGEESRIEGMGSGADDYLVKPFSARELLVRVGALLESAELRRKANEELARNAAQLEALLDYAPLGIYMVDQDLRIAAVNPVARPVFGDIPDLIGRELAEVTRILWPSEEAAKIMATFRHTLDTGEALHVPELVAKREDRGVVEYYEWQVNRIPLPGGRHGVVCYFRDISRMVQAREALRDADRRKDEFIATLSHELRNPLAPIRNSIYLLGMQRNTDPTMARVHDMMERQVNHLVRLVDDLLEMSRITRGVLELRREPTDVAVVVRNAVEAVEPMMQSAGHRLTVSLPPEQLPLMGDVVRLGQVLANVLNNAAKYTDRGGQILLTSRRDGLHAVIRVRDDGIGLDAAERERIFEMFARGEGSKSQGGLGIGLALARKLVQLHGGAIRAESDGPGQGSEFVIVLPLAPLAGVAAASGPGGAQATIARRVLVVDDNRDAGDSLAMILRAMGMDTRVARDGPDALMQLEAFAADLVFLDVGMPGMDGYTVAREIRARGSRAQLVALTGWGQEQDRTLAREAGFNHHLVKPAHLVDLEAVLGGSIEG